MPLADEAVAALSFPRHSYPNVYLHPQRVHDGLTGHLGAIENFVQSVEQARGFSGKLGLPPVAEMGGNTDERSGTSVQFTLGDSLAQALVLRAYLAANGLLQIDVRAAPPMSYVLARGPGGVPYPDADSTWSASIAAQLSRDVAEGVLREHERRLGIRRTDDSHPEYWPSFARTPAGVAVAFLGGRELNHSNAVNWIAMPVTCSIFGTKIMDSTGWSLVTPFHVWFEPPSS